MSASPDDVPATSATEPPAPPIPLRVRRRLTILALLLVYGVFTAVVVGLVPLAELPSLRGAAMRAAGALVTQVGLAWMVARLLRWETSRVRRRFFLLQCAYHGALITALYFANASLLVLRRLDHDLSTPVALGCLAFYLIASARCFRSLVAAFLPTSALPA